MIIFSLSLLQNASYLKLRCTLEARRFCNNCCYLAETRYRSFKSRNTYQTHFKERHTFKQGCYPMAKRIPMIIFHLGKVRFIKNILVTKFNMSFNGHFLHKNGITNDVTFPTVDETFCQNRHDVTFFPFYIFHADKHMTISHYQ